MSKQTKDGIIKSECNTEGSLNAGLGIQTGAKTQMIEYLAAQKEIDVCNLALMFRLINQSHSTGLLPYQNYLQIQKPVTYKGTKSPGEIAA